MIMTQEQKDKPECLIVFSRFNRLIVSSITVATTQKMGEKPVAQVVLVTILNHSNE